MKKILIVLMLFFASLKAEMSTVFPPALQRGDLIGIVFPGSFLDAEDSEAKTIMKRKASWLQLQGYRTIYYPSPEKIRRNGYLSGSDETRATALMDAWQNEDVKAIWCFRGGYGCQRILNLLDYDFIKIHPKIFIGMSDVTAIHQAIIQKTGLVTYLAPVLTYFNNKKADFDEKFAFSAIEKILMPSISQKEIPIPHDAPFEIMRHGKAQGRLIGGNLMLVTSLCGTQWQLDTEGKILVLEDVSEDVYRIDRMLWQLKECGLLDKPVAVILGSWLDCKPSSSFSLTLDQVLDQYFGKANYPVIKNFPTGHDKYQTTLPLNALVEIDTEAKTLKMVD